MVGKARHPTGTINLIHVVEMFVSKGERRKRMDDVCVEVCVMEKQSSCDRRRKTTTVAVDSIKSSSEYLDPTKTVIWNGPMGVFEFEKFAAPTEVRMFLFAGEYRPSLKISIFGHHLNLPCQIRSPPLDYLYYTRISFAQFFPSGRTAKLRNDILMFQQHHGESLSEAWTRFKELLQKVPHHGIDLWLQIQIFYDHVSFHLKCEIDCAASSKLRNKNTDESWEIIKNLALYDHEGWDEIKEFVKPVKAISTPQGPSPQPKAYETNTLNLSTADYMAAHTQMEWKDLRTEHHITQRGEIKTVGRLKLFGSFLRTQTAEPLRKTKVTPDNTEKLNETEMEMPVEEVEKMNEVENGARNKSIKTSKNEEAVEAHDIKLSLVSHSYIYSLGTAEGVLVEVAEHVFPVDFMILDIKENKKRPFILGTPFLTTAKVTIKFDLGTITLSSGKSKVSFYRIFDSSCITDKGVKNDIEPIAPIMIVDRLVLEWEERIKLHLEKEMNFNQWRSNNFKNKQLAHVKVEGGMDDDGEVM
ncbi:zinc finger, CCHC-type containing protein [Tanacetum coccineum]